MRPPSRSRKKPKDFQTPQVVFQPDAAEGLQEGFDQLVNLIRPTLGPLPHVVAVEQIVGRDKMPELLDSGGTIARRIIQIRDRDADVGLMYLRHVLWKLYESEGDGTATAALLFQSIYNAGRRYVTAGGNAMGLRQHLEAGLRLLLKEIDQQVTHLHGKQALAGLARTICYDDELAKMMGEIFDIIGAYGRLEVRKGSGRELIREYVEGMYWDGGLRSREMGNAESGLRANLENAAVLITDLDIETPEDLLPLLQTALENKITQVLLVSSTLSERAMSILLSKVNQEKVFVVAVKVPGMTIEAQRDALEDLAILTGGTPLLKATGDRLEALRLEHFGHARRAWADTAFFGIIGGRGSARQMREHIARLRQTYRAAENGNDRKYLLERLGKLMGGSATLFIGGLSPHAVEKRVELANRTADAMRGAMREGVVPGGGAALLACRAALNASAYSDEDSDARAARTILLHGLEAPFRAISENAGIWPGRALAEIDRSAPGAGLDVTTNQVVDMRAAGILDAAPVVKGALRSAISGAALALTTEAIIHIKNPPEGYNT